MVGANRAAWWLTGTLLFIFLFTTKAASHKARKHLMDDPIGSAIGSEKTGKNYRGADKGAGTDSEGVWLCCDNRWGLTEVNLITGRY